MKNSSLILASLLLTAHAIADSSTANPPATEPTSVVPSMPSTVKQNATPAINTPTPSATPLLTPAAQLTDTEKKKLISEFQKALSSQRSALAHQEKSAMKELTSAQNLKTKKWFQEQKNARHDYFDQHMSGPERRDYVQAYAKKKEEFEASIKSELAVAKKIWAEKSAALKVSQKEQEAKFNASLSQGVRPGPELWPAGN